MKEKKEDLNWTAEKPEKKEDTATAEDTALEEDELDEEEIEKRIEPRKLAYARSVRPGESDVDDEVVTTLIHEVPIILPQPTKFLYHSMRGITRQTEEPLQTGFSSLPSEIIAEIFKELDWRDLLNARQTCTLLYNASKTREIWDNLIRIHAAAAHGPPTISDKPMRMYNAVKLEERFLRWMKTESTWLNEIPLNEKYIPDS
ncbi:hypothetical protein AGABI2DRAFT_123079 [Agaricus bisporus var. bisporus H97]|uniref:hypothetical protein n=1 Tax=Agaricus bisporus var. bisporus (strain H97 / ATCC MYA-4626 / FGSC 10389) TaxID=936046 RepID=UPI00029F6E4F|nr:hypothetical protein AGABI2DRAFT_123079 [Agaricus bisporus var. bisporus H97]EKV41957.1 hypothetical protein AGABI2DRAFT_123079 [Agaricus bisporus var. bisporus H97]